MTGFKHGGQKMKVLIKYLKNWRMYIPFLFFYLELVFHLYMKLDMSYAVVFLLLSFAGGMICAGILFFLPEKPARIAGVILSVGLSVLFVAECVCKDILQQYYQIFSGAETAAGNHLTDYASAVVQSLWDHKIGIFFLLILPVLVLAFFMKILDPAGQKKKRKSNSRREQKLKRMRRKAAVARGIAALIVGAAVHLLALAVIFILPWKGDFTPEKLYQTDTNIDDQVEQLGVITMLRLDIKHRIFGVPENALPEIDDTAALTVAGEKPEEETIYFQSHCHQKKKRNIRIMHWILILKL